MRKKIIKDFVSPYKLYKSEEEELFALMSLYYRFGLIAVKKKKGNYEIYQEKEIGRNVSA